MGVSLGELVANDRWTVVKISGQDIKVRYRPQVFTLAYEKTQLAKKSYSDVCTDMVIEWDLEDDSDELELPRMLPVTTEAMDRWPKVIFELIALHLVQEVRSGKARPQILDPGPSQTDSKDDQTTN